MGSAANRRSTRSPVKKAPKLGNSTQLIKACRGAIGLGPMSQLGQSRRFDGTSTTSGLPQLADIFRGRRHVSKVPIPELRVSVIARLTEALTHLARALSPSMVASASPGRHRTCSGPARQVFQVFSAWSALGKNKRRGSVSQRRRNGRSAAFAITALVRRNRFSTFSKSRYRSSTARSGVIFALVQRGQEVQAPASAYTPRPRRVMFARHDRHHTRINLIILDRPLGEPYDTCSVCG
jgi:hypothetical protein